MSRQLEAAREEKRSRADARILEAVCFGLERDIQAFGVTLHGMTFRFNGADCLAVLRGTLQGEKVVAFVGSDDLEAVILKLARVAKQDKLIWKEDRYK